MQSGELTMNNLQKARNFTLAFVSLLFSVVAVIGLVSMLAVYGNRSASGAPAPPSASLAKGKKTMRSFGSDEELKAYLKKLAEEQRRESRRGLSVSDSAAPAATANQAAGEAKTAEPAKDESITNTQHAGVDEGGIVKLHGDHLVVLRRGRLFT